MITRNDKKSSMELDTTTLVMIGTLIVGVVGALVLFASQPGPTKKRSAQGGLRPRGEGHKYSAARCAPMHSADTHTLLCCRRRGPVRAMNAFHIYRGRRYNIAEEQATVRQRATCHGRWYERHRPSTLSWGFPFALHAEPETSCVHRSTWMCSTLPAYLLTSNFSHQNGCPEQALSMENGVYCKM